MRFGKAVALLSVAWAASNCGGASLRMPRADAGRDTAVGGSGGGDPIPGTPDAAGGAAGISGTGRDSGVGGQGGTGGSTGTGGATGSGGRPGTGGATGSGGRTGTGGATSSGGRTGTGGTTSSGGRPGTGGSGGPASTGGRLGSGGTTGGGGAGGQFGLDGGIDGSTGIAATLFQPLAKAFCAAARTCCSRVGFYQLELDDCEAKLPARLLPSLLVDLGIVTVDPARLTACISAYETAATSCTSTGIESACQGVWVGTRAAGQPCGGTIRFGAFDCVAANGSAACYWNDADRYPATAGVCVALPRGKAGDPCNKTCKTGQDCIVDLVGGAAPLPVMCFEEDGLYCAASANPPVCKPILKAGDACPLDRGACGRANYCDWPTNLCQPAAKLGESCAEDECAEGLGCVSGIRCAEPSFASSSVCKGTPAVP